MAIIKGITDEQGEDGLVCWHIKTSDIVKKINEDRPDDKHLSPQWVGRKLKSMSIRHRTICGRSEIQLTAKEYTTLLDQYGFTRRESANPTETLQEKNKPNQDDMGAVGSSRVSGQAQANGEPPF